MICRAFTILVFFCLGQVLEARPPKADFSLFQGYRRERLDFTISGPHGRPNILSELLFKEIDVYVTRLGVGVVKDRYFFEGYGSYGYIFSGKVVDNDYRFSHRRGQYSHSKHHITGDYTADYGFRLGRAWASLRMSIGYVGYYQKLRFKGGHGWVHNRDFDRLNSTFRAKWYGPEWGIGLNKSFTKVDASLYYRLLYPLCYHANGHWNLREKGARHFTLKSASTKSFGNIAGFSCGWSFFRNWKVFLEYEFMKFYAKDGHMHIKVGNVPLNRAHLSSQEVRCTIGYQF